MNLAAGGKSSVQNRGHVMNDLAFADVLPKLTGKISAERIRLMRTPRPSKELIDGFKRIGDATSVISDIMDELGITGV
ncbi:MAG: hypothetical protein E5W60_08870, partial [Mesorhizobium sp.]